MIINNGRPDTHGRLQKEIKTYDMLDALGIGYLQADHEPAMTMEACTAVGKALGVSICKNLLLCNRQCTQFYLLMMPDSKPFKTKDLSAQLGVARLSFADGSYMERFLDISPGSLSVIGLMNDTDNNVRLLIDRALLSEEYVGFHPCINTSSVRITTKELLEAVIPAMHRTPTFVDLPEYKESDNI